MIIETCVITLAGYIFVFLIFGQMNQNWENRILIPYTLLQSGVISHNTLPQEDFWMPLLGQSNSHIYITDKDGFISESYPSMDKGLRINDIPLFSDISLPLNFKRNLYDDQGESFRLGAQFYSDDEQKYYVFVDLPKTLLHKQKLSILHTIFLGMPIFLIVSFIMILIIMEFLLAHRLTIIDDSLKEVEQGNFMVRTPVDHHHDEITRLQTDINAVLVSRQSYIDQINHLNRVLDAIRNINQLIVQERDKDKLLRKACVSLSHIDQYQLARIYLEKKEEGQVKCFSSIRGQETVTIDQFSIHDNSMGCRKVITNKQGAHIIPVATCDCNGCRFYKDSRSYNVMGIRLEYGTQFFGVLNIHVNLDYEIDERELSLFEEVAGDISYALFNIDLENERSKIASALIESENRFKLAMKASQEGLYDWNFSNDEIYLSPGWKSMLGYGYKDIPNNLEALKQLMQEEDYQKFLYYADQLKEGARERFVLEVKMRHKEGHWIDVLSRAQMIFDSTGKPSRLIGTHLDITKRKAIEDKIKDDLEERNTLIKELYHRTKNNMQLIISLLSMKMTGIKDESLNNVLYDVENKIQSMALVHQMLYESQNLSKIDFKTYILQLVDHSIDDDISLVESLESIEISIDVALPLGMIFSELITNSIQHGFYNHPDDKPKEIHINQTIGENNIIHLTYRDNGMGLPVGFDPSSSEHMGFQTIINLVEGQLKGRIKWENDPGQGVTWFIDFGEWIPQDRL